MNRRCAALLLVLSAAAVLAAFVRPGYRVEIRGHNQPGIMPRLSARKARAPPGRQPRKSAAGRKICTTDFSQCCVCNIPPPPRRI